MKKIVLYITILAFLTVISCNEPDDLGTLSINDYDAFVGEEITFYHDGAENLNYAWDFGDGNSSSEYSPKHTFERPGKFNITVKGFGQNGTLRTFNTFVASIRQATFPDARFEVSDNKVTPDEEIEFTPVNTFRSGVRFLWDFGDGNSSSEEAPVHSYEKSGVYIVSLKVTNELREVDEFFDTISVNNLAQVTINVKMEMKKDFWGDYYDELYIAVYSDHVKYKSDSSKLFDYVWWKDAIFAGKLPPYNLTYPIDVQKANADAQFTVTFQLDLNPIFSSHSFHIYEGSTDGYFSNKDFIHRIHNLKYGEKRVINTEARFYNW